MEQGSPLCYKYQHTLNELESWKTVDLRPKRAGRPSDMARVQLPPLYDGPRPIGAAKWRDLQDLLCYFHPIYHPFYNRMISDHSSHHSNEDDASSTEADSNC